MPKQRIALIPGDGIGKEVVPEGVRVLEAVARRYKLDLQFTDLDWSCDRFLKTGAFMPKDGMDTLRGFDAIYLGAVGWPGVPDHISLWGLLIPIRRDFDPGVAALTSEGKCALERPVKECFVADSVFHVVDYFLMTENGNLVR